MQRCQVVGVQLHLQLPKYAASFFKPWHTSTPRQTSLSNIHSPNTHSPNIYPPNIPFPNIPIPYPS
jgi:hypothetical protein